MSGAAQPPAPAPGEAAFVALQYLLPQHALSRLLHAVARARAPWLKNALVRTFLRLYRIDMSEAAQPDPFAYGSFNEFFTRALRSDARRIDAAPDSIVSPVDGAISECGAIEGDTLLQAKGRRYRLDELLAGQPWAAAFTGGVFATIYLAPYDYHRIHMPLDGRLEACVYVPGRLFSVNAATARRVPRLFARNERILTLFDTAVGRVALVMVGALNVGSMATVWAGDVTPAPRRALSVLPVPQLTLAKGAEVGRFNLGSTVILLFEPGRATLRPRLAAGAKLKLGESIALAAPPGGRP